MPLDIISTFSFEAAGMVFFSRFFNRKPIETPIPDPVRTQDRTYRRFTREFDEVVEAKYLPDLLMSPPDRPSLRFEAATHNFSRRFQSERLEIYEWASPFIRKFIQTNSISERQKTVVSFLIDHSNSMRGMKMISALVAVESAVSILEQCGIATEILGFTTRSWHGGESRKKWRKCGSPRNPGRLCDLRHIVYRGADDLVSHFGYLHYALHPDLTRENVDGEALEWAATRLSAERWAKRAVCIISDGAPGDDSTIMANDDRKILVNHLKEIEDKVCRDGVQVSYLLMNSLQKHRDFNMAEIAHEPETAGKGLINLFTRMFVPELGEELTDP